MTLSAEMFHERRPYPVMKESGVRWFGEIPAHWEIQRQRNVVEMRVSNVDKHSVEGEVPVRLCNYVDVYKNERITARIQFMRATASQEEIERFRILRGDVLITKDSEEWNDIGVPALVEYDAPDLICGYHLAILRPYKEIISGDYLLRALQSKGVAYQYYVSANGVTRYGLSHDSIKSIIIPIPPLEEQSAIARFLEYLDSRIRRYIGSKNKLGANRQVDLLREYRTRMITDVVTGKLDVRAIKLPEVVEAEHSVPLEQEVDEITQEEGLATEEGSLNADE